MIDTNLDGTDVATKTNIATKSDCIKECLILAPADCQFWSWDRSTKICHIKGSASGSQLQAYGVISSPRRCPIDLIRGKKLITLTDCFHFHFNYSFSDCVYLHEAPTNGIIRQMYTNSQIDCSSWCQAEPTCSHWSTSPVQPEPVPNLNFGLTHNLYYTCYLHNSEASLAHNPGSVSAPRECVPNDSPGTQGRFQILMQPDFKFCNNMSHTFRLLPKLLFAHLWQRLSHQRQQNHQFQLPTNSAGLLWSMVIKLKLFHFFQCTQYVNSTIINLANTFWVLQIL